MPWNDTAQLNFLNAEVREAVIQTILEVARKFSVIRFDAAMTLAKKHYKRLWYPEPGSGGAIPSRAEVGLTREQFDAAMPQEFWREVVDRVAREVPDTLLLAEAFWMMEGYFVRTLGMHRVYNSAFMNMLKNEDNANYRTVLKNTLEFNPEILKRFVNFMNNPDEDTAVAQFGNGDKYFGVCTLMATLPGLPMFGHGQIEGFTEKYGMEYRRAYRDETPDPELMRRHEREIFPLLRRRYLFAEVEQFFLYDLVTPEGHVNEDVYAYSNRAGDERALVLYHNRYASTRGWVRTSVGYLGKTGRGKERALMQKSLGTGMGLNPAEDHFTIFRDNVTGLEYIRNNQELCTMGLYVEVHAYKCHVFLDFRQVRDNESRQYAQLAASLEGRGVPDMDEALRSVFLLPIHRPFKDLVNAHVFRELLAARVTVPHGFLNDELLDGVQQKVLNLLRALKHFAGGAGDEAALARTTRLRLEAVLQLPVVDGWYNWPSESQAALKYLQANLKDDPGLWACLFAWVFVHGLGEVVVDAEAQQRSRSWLDEWQLSKILAGAFRDMGLGDATVARAVRLVGLLTANQCWFPDASLAKPAPAKVPAAYRVLECLLKDDEGQQFLGVNRFEEVVWFTGEALEELIWWLFTVAIVQSSANPDVPSATVIAEIEGQYQVVQALQRAEETADYQLEKLLEAARGA